MKKNTQMKKIGFIGIGVMGYHMASHLLKKKNLINIIERKSAKTKAFTKKYSDTNKIKVYSSLKELTLNSEIIITCVGNDNDLKDVYLKKNSIIDRMHTENMIKTIISKWHLINRSLCYLKPFSIMTIISTVSIYGT